MKYLSVFIASMFVLLCVYAQPRVLPSNVNEVTIEYNMLLVSNGAAGIVSQSKTVYIKGLHMRSDVEGEDFHQTILFNKKTNQGTLLREIGSNRFMTPLDAVRMSELNKKYNDRQMLMSGEEKEILGYPCRKALLTFTNGYKAVVWYLPGVKTQVTENDFQFAELPGIVMEYEGYTQQTNQTLRYTAIRLSLAPVPQAVFEPSLTGYRMLNR